MTGFNTVIVATFNSASHAPLRECLASIRRQRTRGPVRLVVVDGGSTDTTIDVARSSNAEIVENPAISELGFKGGKNLALSLADSDLVTFVDADNILIEDDYLERMSLPLIANPRIDVAVPCPYVPPRGVAPSITRYFCLRERDYWVRLSQAGRAEEGWIEFRPESAIIPNAGVMRRSALIDTGGWDYDTEVAARLIAGGRGTFAFVPDVHRFHMEMTSYREVWRKFNRRVVHQLGHIPEKPSVENELEDVRRHPMHYIRNELAEPVANCFHRRDGAYLQSLPVFGIKLSVVLVRGAW